MLNTSTLGSVTVEAEELGRALTKARERVGISKAELARRYGADPAVIGRFESGEQIPSLPKLYRLCASLGVDITELLEDAGVIRRPSTSTRHAIETDRTLPERLRESVLSTYDHMQEIQRKLLADLASDGEQVPGGGDESVEDD